MLVTELDVEAVAKHQLKQMTSKSKSKSKNETESESESESESEKMKRATKRQAN